MRSKSVQFIFSALAAFAGILAVGPQPARAEYRVFELEIKDSTNGAARSTVTTLDDIQYRYYNPIKQTEVVSIKETWMCYPRSDYFKRLCPKPPPKPAKS